MRTMSPSEQDAESKPSPERRPAVPPIPGFAPRAEDRFAHLFRRIPAAWLILGAGVISTGIYLLFVLAFPLTRWWNHPHTADNPDAINDLGRITGYSPAAALAFVAALLILFSCQFAVLQGVSRLPQEGSTRGLPRVLRWAVFLFPVVFGAIMVWMQSITTTDLYGYVARGYLYAQLHQNPMITKALLLPGGLSVDRPPSPYGPAWILVTGLVSEVAGNSLLLNLLLFKLIGFAGVLVAIWLVDYLARRLYPQRRLRIVVLFSWCPLLFFDSIGNGHNDIIMMVCVLAAFALMLSRRARTAFAFLVVGALIKYVSAILIPLWLVFELRSRLRPDIAASESAARVSPPVEPTVGESGEEATLGERSRDLVIEWVRGAATTVREIDPKAAFSLLTSAGLIGLLLIVACYAPFWAGINTFTGLGQQLRPLYYNSSIVGFISAPLQLLVPASKDAALDKTLRLIFYTLFFIYAYIQTQRLWILGNQATMRDVITASAKVTFAALLLITFWFQPWYVVWVLPLAALAEAPFVRRQGLILAAGALMTYSVANFLLVGDTNLVQGFFVQFFEIIIAFGPLLLLRVGPSYDQGWVSIVRRYAGLIGRGFAQRPVFWERLMVVLVLVVAILLRLVRLDNLFVSAPLSSEEGSILRQASSDLRLYVSDPQGLQGPFVAAQGILVHIFGETAFAVLLPSAIIGSITVLVIYLMTTEIMRQGGLSGNRTIAILAALLAATSQWHVSLSRSGMEVVILPLLMCTAMYWLLVALRKSAPSTTAPQGTAPAQRTPALRAHPRIRERERPHPRLRRRVSRDADHPAASGEVPLARAISIPALFYYIGCGICTGLACDLEPGLWLVPLIIAGLLIVWHWRTPKGFQVSRTGLIWLVISALVAGSPVVWHYLSDVVGFPKGSGLLARSSVAASVHPVLSPPFWVQAADNFGGALNLLISQDYTAGYPSAGGASIIPVLLGPFFFLGLLALLIRWRSFESLVLVLLIALPLVASVAVGTPTSVIEAASVLPALCIVPALGLYEIVSRLGHLPIVLDRINGARVFSTPEQIGRILLLGFLLFSTVRTFFWYFEASLPPHQNQYNASWIGSPVVYGDLESTPGTVAVLSSTENGASSAGKSVVISQNWRGPCPLPKSSSVSTE
jgi:4-amino-4-deoxy-L-arabinose transferase-like glycosyltransferase